MICFNKEEADSDIRAFAGVAQFVQCSTVCTYGVQYDYMPVDETHPLRHDYRLRLAQAKSRRLTTPSWLRIHGTGFPVTIIKPSTTYGPKSGMLRQVAWDLSWIDRVRKGKPIAICGDGKAPHQFLHVNDAALAFAGVLGKECTIGQVYNMTRRGFITWADYHALAMKVLGRDVDMVGIPLADIVAHNVPASGICAEIFAHNCYYDSTKLFRDIPEFTPQVSLESGMASVIAALDRDGRVPNSDDIEWEDTLIAAQRRVREY